MKLLFAATLAGAAGAIGAVSATTAVEQQASTLESALNFLSNFNTTRTVASVEKFLHGVVPYFDSADVDCVAASRVSDFVDDVLPSGSVDNVTLASWKDLQPSESFMEYYKFDEVHGYFAVKYDASQDCYNFVTGTVTFDNKLPIKKGNTTSKWVKPDDYDYNRTASKNRSVEELTTYYLGYESLVDAVDAEWKTQYFHGVMIPPEWRGDRLRDDAGNIVDGRDGGIFDLAIQGIEQIAKDLGVNASALAGVHPDLSKDCTENTCLGFSHFQARIDSAQIECVDAENLNDFVAEVFEEIYQSANSTDQEALKRELAILDYGSNVSWVVNRAAYDVNSTTSTNPGFAHFWKQKDPTRDCSNWVTSFIVGDVTIAPDLLIIEEQHSYLWGLMSSTSISYSYVPHKFSPQDGLAMTLYFQTLNNNGLCAATGANATIDSFPPIDCGTWSKPQ